MDLLGLFKDKIVFLKLKYVETPYTVPATRDPQIWCGSASSSPEHGLAPIGCRRGSGGMRAAQCGVGKLVARDGSG
jgi:hypothetical protein